MDLKGNVFFDGPAGRIEAILKEPGGPVSRAAVICHPHPLFGGTMHNKVVYRIAKAFEKAGFAVLRFNFRGTGRSEGAHDQGRGEQDDLRAAIEFIERKYPEAELWIAGFSFGSMVMLQVACGNPRVRAVVAAGVPATKYELEYAVDCPQPKLYVQGAQDEFGPADAIRALFDRLSEPKQLRIVENTDHFFEGRLDELGQAVSEFIQSVG